ncbi:MAG: hypothetical protein V4736_14350 [Bdellovibrionota bacterium]
MKINKLISFIGVWKTSGEIYENPFGAKGVLKGIDSYRFGNGHDFIVHSVNVKMAGKKIKNCEVISYDSKKNAFAMYAFENGSVAGIQYGKLKGKVWSVSSSKVRFRGRFNKGNSRLSGLWEFKNKNRVWKPWIKIELNKN